MGEKTGRIHRAIWMAFGKPFMQTVVGGLREGWWSAVGWTVLVALLAAALWTVFVFGPRVYDLADSEGWIPHPEESWISADGTWLVGESRICTSSPYRSDPVLDEFERKINADTVAPEPQRSVGYAFSNLTCDAGPAHRIKITFWGRREQPEYISVSWKCTRGSSDFTCTEISGRHAELDLQAIAEGRATPPPAAQPTQIPSRMADQSIDEIAKNYGAAGTPVESSPAAPMSELPTLTDPNEQKSLRTIFSQPGFFNQAPEQRRAQLRSIPSYAQAPDPLIDKFIEIGRSVLEKKPGLLRTVWEGLASPVGWAKDTLSNGLSAKLERLAVITIVVVFWFLVFWFSYRTPPLGDLPYRWATLAGVGAGMVCVNHIIAVSDTQRSADPVVLCHLALAVSAFYAAQGIFKRRKYGVLAYFSTIALQVAMSAFLAHRGEVAVFDLVIGSALAAIPVWCNAIYFKRRWRHLA